jgi:hypothetical protein
MKITLTQEEYDRRASVAYGWDLSCGERDARIATFLGAHSCVVIIGVGK